MRLVRRIDATIISTLASSDGGWSGPNKIPSYLVPWNPTSRNRCEEVGHLADPFYCVTVTVIAFEVIVLLPLT
jgi:hypothetical protein